MRDLRWFALGAGMFAVAAGVLIMTMTQGGDKKDPPRAKGAPPVAAPQVVKIVSSMPRTGNANAQTTTIANGIKMAIEERGGNLDQFEIKYEDWDDASAKKGDWDPEVEANNAARAAADPDVLFYIGTYNSGAAKIAIPILNRANLVMISPANTYPGLTKPELGEPGEPEMYRPSGKVTYFRVVPADDIQGMVAAEWMRELGGVSVYILDDRGLYGKGIADVLEVRAGGIGLKVLGHEGIDPKAQEYRSLMTKIKALNPDFVFFGGSPQTNAGQIAKDLVATGLRAKLLVPDACYEQAFITAAGPQNLEGRVFLTFGGMPPDELKGKGADFVARYAQKYGSMPEAYAIYGYVAAQVALKALLLAGKKDREEVRQAMFEVAQGNEGVLGNWQFDENGDTTLTTMSGNTVKDGKFAFMKLLGQQ